MSILIKHDNASETKALILAVFHQIDSLPQNVIDECIAVESVPVPEPPEGKEGVPYINPQSKEIWYEYADKPLTPEEKIEQLESQVIMMSGLLNSLLFPTTE